MDSKRYWHMLLQLDFHIRSLKFSIFISISISTIQENRLIALVFSYNMTDYVFPLFSYTQVSCISPLLPTALDFTQRESQNRALRAGPKNIQTLNFPNQEAICNTTTFPKNQNPIGQPTPQRPRESVNLCQSNLSPDPVDMTQSRNHEINHEENHEEDNRGNHKENHEENHEGNHEG